MNQERLTAEQALNVLVQVANQVKLTLQEGETVKQALNIIGELVTSKEAVKEDPQPNIK